MKKLAIFIGIFLVLVLGLVFYSLNKSDNSGTTGNTSLLEEKISADELAVHNNLDDCWVAYKGKVYDITSFLPKHSGSAEVILPYCGSSSEFEKAFIAKHGEGMSTVLVKVSVLIGDFEFAGNLNN